MATTDPTLIAPPSSAAVEDERVVGRTLWQLFWYRFKQDRAALFGLGVVIFLILIALFAPLLARLVGHGPNDLRFQNQVLSDIGLPKGPSGSFLMGADLSGRDVFVRVLYGTRTSFEVAVVATAFATTVGITLGIIAGFFGKWVDTAISRFIDIVLSMPLLVFAIGISAACSVTKEGCLGGLIKPGVPLVIFIISLFSWTYIARIIRGQTLSLREREFIEAARSLGSPNRRIMFREVLPNLVAPIIIYASLLIPANVLFEAYLSFLGLGVPQSVPSWGAMIAEGSRNIEITWWLMLFPGLMLLITTLAFNLLGDGLRDALDPRSGRG